MANLLHTCFRTSRLIGLILAVAYGAPAFAAGKSLTIWVGDERAAAGFRKVAESYSKQTGVKIEVAVQEQPVDAFEGALNNNQTGPDIIVWPHDHIGDWVRKGWLAPVAVSPKLKANVFQVAWDAVTSNGKQWAYPIAVEALTVVYNKSIISEPPKAYEDIPVLQQKLKAKGITAMAWELHSPYFTWPLLAAGGANVFQRDLMGNYLPKQTGVNHPGAIKGAEFLAKMVKADVLSPTMMTGDAEEAMKSGKLAVLVTGPWAWEGLNKSGIKFGIAPLPTFGGKPARPFIGVLGAMISARSANRQVAADFIEKAVVTSQGLQAFNTLRPLGIPASKELFWSFYSDAQIRKAMESVFAGSPMPNNPEMQFFWKHLDKALGDIIANSAKPKEALDAAAKAIAAGE